MDHGCQLRPATLDDLPEIVEIFQAEELRYRGHTDLSLSEVQERFAADAKFDPERDLACIELDGRLIGAAVISASGANLAVRPEHEDERLRVDLLEWTETRQIELAREPVRVGVPAAHAPTVTVLLDAGYVLERSYARMIRDFSLTGPPEPADVASGYRLRMIDPAEDVGVLHDLNERAFRERPDHREEALEAYDKRHISFSQFAPAWSLIAETTDGRPAGSLIGWRPPDHPHGLVALLAVDPDHRRHGLLR